VRAAGEGGCFVCERRERGNGESGLGVREVSRVDADAGEHRFGIDPEFRHDLRYCCNGSHPHGVAGRCQGVGGGNAWSIARGHSTPPLPEFLGAILAETAKSMQPTSARFAQGGYVHCPSARLAAAPAPFVRENRQAPTPTSEAIG